MNEQERSLIDLLEYALLNKKVDKGSYYIGKITDLFSQNDKICLLKNEDSTWSISYVERGIVSNKSIYFHFRDAITCFYWKLCREDTPWDYRQEWETVRKANASE
jgi:hypothetical protein